jgi:hypothetical protein
VKGPVRELLWNAMAGASGVLAFVTSVGLAKIYHGSHELALNELIPLFYLLFSFFIFTILWKLRYKCLTKVVQVWMWLSLIVGLTIRYGAVFTQEWGSWWVFLVAITVLMLGLLASYKASPKMWSGLRRTVAVVPWLIVATPLFVGQVMSKQVVWLEAKPANNGGKTATVVLLFDELNAHASLGLQDVLAKHGLRVSYKAVQAVHGSTVEVVPAMFTGLNFEGARACGFTQVCAEGAALDFSEIAVLRDDVDVVGFHHPYCAIKGLRTCQRLTTNRSILEDGRWDCGIRSRLGLLSDGEQQTCQEKIHKTWTDLQDLAITAMMAAPALKDGGVLSVHLPFPHPPARGTGTLSEQYRANLLLGESVLDELLHRLEANRVEPRILIYADHPLRQIMWCKNGAMQFDMPCVVDQQLDDSNVPLIVAAKSELPRIDHIDSNLRVFDVLREWLRH